MQKPTDEQVLKYIDSVPGLRDEWGIPGSRRIGIVTFVLMSLLLLVVAGGTIFYFAMGDPKLTGKGFSGLIIVIVLAFAAAITRMFQLKSERKQLPGYRKALADAFTGDPRTDTEKQDYVDQSFHWEAKRLQTAARMIGIAGIVIIAINTYQIGGTDFVRTLLFDGAILSYLAGALWTNYAFKAEALEVMLEERTRATIVWQHEHPGEAQKQEEEDSKKDSAADLAEFDK